MKEPIFPIRWATREIGQPLKNLAENGKKESIEIDPEQFFKIGKKPFELESCRPTIHHHTENVNIENTKVAFQIEF